MIVNGVKVSGCKGVFVTYGRAKDASLDEMIFKNCTLAVADKRPLSFSTTGKTIVKNSTVTYGKQDDVIWCYYVDKLTVKGCKVKIYTESFSDVDVHNNDYIYSNNN